MVSLILPHSLGHLIQVYSGGRVVLNIALVIEGSICANGMVIFPRSSFENVGGFFSAVKIWQSLNAKG